MPAFLGMRGTGDWVTDERPKSWREMILFLYPNADSPLTALMSKMSSERVDDPEFNWWTKILPTQAGDVTAVHTAETFDAAYDAGTGEADDVLYIKMAEVTAKEFRVGHQALLRNNVDHNMDLNAKVVKRVLNGANSYLGVKLLQDDTEDSVIQRVMVIGNINSEGAAMPDALSYDPTKWNNLTQIFRTPLEITRTAKRTRVRTGDRYKEMKREALEMHGVEMEKAFLYGIKTEKIGDNGKPERTTQGLIPSIKAGGTVSDFSLAVDTAYAGKTWIQAGELWLDTVLEVIFRYGRTEKLVFAGSGAILGLNRLIKAVGAYELKPMTTSYGIKVLEWVTPFGSVYLKTHPLLSYEPTTRNSMVVFEPENLKYRYIDDTTFYGTTEKEEKGYSRRDGTKEEYLTECGLEYHHPIGWAFLNGVGKDNTVT